MKENKLNMKMVQITQANIQTKNLNTTQMKKENTTIQERRKSNRIKFPITTRSTIGIIITKKRPQSRKNITAQMKKQEKILKELKL